MQCLCCGLWAEKTRVLTPTEAKGVLLETPKRVFAPECVRAKLRPTLGLSRKNPRCVGRSVTGSPSQPGPAFNPVQPRTDDGHGGGPLGCLEVAHRRREGRRTGWRGGVPSLLLGPRSAPPPQPQSPCPKPQDPSGFLTWGVSTSMTPRQRGVSSRTFGSISGAVMGQASSAPQTGRPPPRLPPRTHRWLDVVAKGPHPPGSVGCQGPPAQGAQPRVWFSHSRDQVRGPLGSFMHTASAGPTPALLQASEAWEWAGVSPADGGH